MAELGRIRWNWDVIVATSLLTPIDTRLGILNEKLWAVVQESFTSINELQLLFQWSHQTFYFIFFFFFKVVKYGWFMLPPYYCCVFKNLLNILEKNNLVWPLVTASFWQIPWLSPPISVFWKFPCFNFL